MESIVKINDIMLWSFRTVKVKYGTNKTLKAVINYKYKGFGRNQTFMSITMQVKLFGDKIVAIVNFTLNSRIYHSDELNATIVDIILL